MGKAAAPDADMVRVLRSQDLTLDDVPQRGRKVRLRGQANRHRGGTYETVTDRVHPDNRLLAIRAAAAVGLDIAGVDFICPDISRSHLEVGGAICEVNARPGLLAGAELPKLAAMLVEHLFPAPADGRIPVVCVLGDADAAPLIGKLEKEFQKAGLVPVSAGPGGMRVDGVAVSRREFGPEAAARAVLGDTQTTAGIVHVTYAGVREAGLALSHIDVALVDKVATGEPALHNAVVALVRGIAKKTHDWKDESGWRKGLGFPGSKPVSRKRSRRT
jgi:cyanophycin synthetase